MAEEEKLSGAKSASGGEKDQKKDQNKEEKKPFDKRILIIGIIVIIVIAVVAWLVVRSEGSGSGEVQGTKEEVIKEVEKPKTVPESKYFSEKAEIMFFYSNNCGWCEKQKEILGQLGYEGYRFKPMNVGDDPSLWEEYKISGTPTIVALNGDRLIGYREKTELKKWIDKHLK